MSDDFMNDIEAAVNDASDASNINNETAPERNQESAANVVNNGASEKGVDNSVEAHINELFDGRTNTPAKEETPTEKSVAAVTSDDNNKDEEAAKQQPTARSQKKPQGQRLLDTYFRENEKGDLVDKQGNVVALAGSSRNIYEAIRAEGREQREAAEELAIKHMQLGKQFKELYQQAQEFMSSGSDNEFANVVKSSGYSAEEAKSALDLMKAYKADPIAAIKTLLTQAQMSGIDVSKIGANITADPALLKSTMAGLLEERLGPLSEKAQQDQEAEATAHEVSTFFRDFPEAEQFAGAIGEAIQQFPDMSLQEAWLRLQKELRKQQTAAASSRPSRYRKRSSRQISAKVGRPALPDYGKMTFEQIAKSIQEDT